MRNIGLLSCVVVAFFAASLDAAEWGLKKGSPDLKTAGPLAFGPDGILLVGDTKAAAVYAIDTGDTKGDPSKVEIQVENVKQAIAALLKAGSADIKINDLVVSPASGNVYLSVSNSATPALVRIDASGKLSQVPLKDVGFAKVELPNAPEDKPVRTRRGVRNPRDTSITDLAFSDGKVLVSGVIKGGERGLSTVREIPFPFVAADSGVRIEIYHGAHGQLENYAAVRTFVPFIIDGEPSLLAGFTCTPLVRFDVKSFKGKDRVRGTTVAELGNRNTPYDMIVYEKDGATFLLMANDRRGVMKISTEDIGRKEGITERVSGGGVAGQTYETIKELEGVNQLDKLNDDYAVVIVGSGDSHDLKTVALP